MDPFDVGLFSDGDAAAPLPAIRIVFMLGSDDPDVTFPARKILVLPAGSLRTTFSARGCRQGRSRALVMIYSHIRSGAVGIPLRDSELYDSVVSRVDFLPNGNSLEGETRERRDVAGRSSPCA